MLDSKGGGKAWPPSRSLWVSRTAGRDQALQPGTNIGTVGKQKATESKKLSKKEGSLNRQQEGENYTSAKWYKTIDPGSAATAKRDSGSLDCPKFTNSMNSFYSKNRETVG